MATFKAIQPDERDLTGSQWSNPVRTVAEELRRRVVVRMQW